MRHAASLGGELGCELGKIDFRKLRLEKAATEGRDITVRDVAEVVGYTPTTVLNVERKKHIPRSDVFLALLEYYGFDIVRRADGKEDRHGNG